MNCFLCLKIILNGQNSIAFNSSKWQDLNILYIVEKHLWEMENLYIYSHLCQTCWQEVYNFHKFYSEIETAHENFKILKKTIDFKAFSSGRKSIGGEQNEKPQTEFALVEKTNLLKLFTKEINSLEETSKRKIPSKKTTRRNSKVTCRKESNSTEINRTDTAKDREEICINFKEIENDSDEIIDDENTNDQNNSLESNNDPFSDGVDLLEQLSQQQASDFISLKDENPLEIAEKSVVEINSLKDTSIRDCSLSNNAHNENQSFTRSVAKRTEQNENSCTEINKTEHTKKLDELEVTFKEVENYIKETSIDQSFIESVDEDCLDDHGEICESDNAAQSPNAAHSAKLDQTPEEEDELIAEHFEITCNYCEIKLPTFYIMIKHCKEAHKKRGYVLCCNSKYYFRPQLVDHIKLHQNPEYFKCKYCNKVLVRRMYLKKHIESVHENKGCKCNVCGKVLANEKSLNRHNLLHDPDEKLHCKPCNKNFASKMTLKKHIDHVHLKKQHRICDMCGKSLVGHTNFKRHMEQHKGRVKPTVTCEICGRVLSDTGCLTRHIRSHHPPEGVQPEFKCSKCTKIFTSSANLKRHIKDVHDKAHQIKCTLCDKIFMKSGALRDHMARHTGKPSRECGFCHRAFYSNGNMYAHRKKMHPKEWEESKKKNYSGNLPDKYLTKIKGS